MPTEVAVRRASRSVVAGAVAADRRMIAGAVAANGAPNLATDGFQTDYAEYLGINFLLNDAATSLEWRLWLYDTVSETWSLDNRPGVAGTVTITSTDTDRISIIAIPGVNRIYVELLTFAGVFVVGVDVWGYLCD